MNNRIILRWIIPLIIIFFAGNCFEVIHADTKTRIAVFQWNESEEIYSRSLEGVLAQLKEAGYILNRNLSVDFYQAHSDMELAKSYTIKIKNNKYDLVISLGTQSTQILQQNNLEEHPVVFTGVFDPLQAKLVSNLNGSKTNYTGTSHRQSFYRQFIDFSKIVPGVKRLGFIFVKGETAPDYQLEEIQAEKAKLGLEVIIPIPIEDSATAVKAVQTLAGKVDAIYLPSDSMQESALAKNIASNALLNKIPVFSALSYPVKSGAVISTYTNLYLLGKQAGKMAIEILNGADPGNLPIQVQYYPEIAINRDYISKLGFSVPTVLLSKVTGVVGSHVSFFSDETVENNNNKRFDLTRGVFELNMNGETVESILQEINTVFDGMNYIHFDIVGNAQATLTYHNTHKSLYTLIHCLVREAGYLDIQRDKTFTIYGNDADKALDGRNISYIYKLKALPVDTAQQKAQAVGKKVEVNFIKENSTLVINGPFDDVKETVSFLESADFEPPVISIQLLIVQYQHDDQFKWGINLSSAAAATYKNRIYDPGNGNFLTSVTKLDTTFLLNLKALISNGKAKVITNPQLAVRNGESASLDLAQEKNIVLESGNVESGVVTSQLTQFTAGTSLQVTPTTMQDGLTLLTVTGSLAVFVDSDVQNQYITETNTVNTAVNVRDDETLIIGGLIKREETNSDTGIPVLRKLPLFGNLFKSKQKKVEYIETVLYITPRVTSPNQTDLQLYEHLLDEMDQSVNKK